MLRIGKLSSQRTKVISISEAGRRQSRQHAPELESVLTEYVIAVRGRDLL